ncbi:hypothetical protein H2198_005535 [Neophaeococcomyces mojaviensis]|uniref:Uncharacterized protein n=1 Tax=Neophaeococcomyces mojaviensis TaxID=3383035 RepID=A0ACC3A5C3_9EURO|nr:hypothetical protein H2198_005535 [Knufia sp. JES_112]
MSDSQELELPPLLAYPPEDIKGQLPPQEWESCLELWISSVELRLKFLDAQFSKASKQTLGVPFLLSYLPQHESRVHELVKGSNASQLDKLCYLLLRKICSQPSDAIDSATYFDLLSQGSAAFGNHESWRRALKSVWTKNSIGARKAIESAKSALATSTLPHIQQDWLQKLSSLTKALPETATVTVAGADYLDTLNDIYKDGMDELKRAVTANVFYSFAALLDNKHVTILTDNIYHLKSEADRLRKSSPSTTTLLSSLLGTTSFLRHFSSNSEVASRKQNLIEQLSSYRQHMLHLHPLPVKRRSKEKGRAEKSDGLHMHKAAQVSQVHELFPDLSTAYIMKALDHFSDNVEAVIAALLEPASLPDDLKDQSVPDADVTFDADLTDLAPRSTPPPLPQKKSIFDNDEFDRLQISTKQLRRGKKNINIDETVDGGNHAKSKAAIMSALAAFDSDDDERDDTYDVADVGGAVDNTVDTDERRLNMDSHEATLFKTWKESPELFSRDSKTRASNLRQQLKRETGMGDEQIEGWAIMLKKDPKMENRLRDKYSAVKAFGGNQRALESTRWQASASAENSDVDSGPERSNDARRIGQAGIRGHRDFGRGAGRGGGSTSGPPDAAATQAARRQKEQGRGRGGANQRRNARARKIGRGMGPLPA